MKNLSHILTYVLLLAVAVLYYLHFTSNQSTSSDTDEAQIATNNAAGTIAYINFDSLLTKYDFYKDKVQVLEAKKKKLETDLQNRASGLEREFNNFQKNAPNMTIAQGRAKEEELLQKRQNLLNQQQNLTIELQRDEALVNGELYDNVTELLSKIGLEKDLQVVLTYTRGSGVLYANDSLNITEEVLARLNSSYSDTQSTDSTAVAK